MAIVMNNEKYETKPFDCWQMVKELRSKHFWHTWHAQKQGELLFLGMVFQNHGFLRGWGHYANPSIGVHFTRLARTPNAEGLVKVIEAAEAWGLGRDVCGAMKDHVGQVFAGLSQTSPTGEKFHHDLAICGSDCHAIRKTTQIAAEYLNVPYFFIDYSGERYDEKKHRMVHTENAKKYWFGQMMDAIEWVAKVIGRKYDPEAAGEALKTEWHSRIMWAKCMQLMQNVPTPMSLRTAFSLRLPLVTNTADPDVARYTDVLYDELKHRVANKITDHKYEKIRLNHENLHPLYRADVLRSPEAYGAVFVNSRLLEDFAVFSRDDNCHYYIPENPFDKGLEIKTVEDVLNNVWLMRTINNGHEVAENRPEYTYSRAKEWQCGAIVVHNDRPCQRTMLNSHERDLYIRERGIPVGKYTSSQGDPRDFDERRILGPGGELPIFYESLGLTRLENS